MILKFDISDQRDDRSKFANDVCYFIYQQYNGDIEAMMPIVGEMYDHFSDHVSNIYELIEKEIPLFALHALLQFSKENFGMTQEEYDETVLSAKLACTEFYSELIREVEITDCLKFEREEVEAQVRESYTLKTKPTDPDIPDEKFWYDNSELIRAAQVRQEVGLEQAIRLYPHLAELLRGARD